MNPPPSRLTRAAFVELYGRVWENSSWVAEAAHAAGLGPAQDSADGLHGAMTAAMRESSLERRKALLLAHPDLAGKLAAAGELTPESTGEQASAGLDRLTGDERVRFTALNEAYKARFGIPFVIAVKGLSKDEIVAAFEARLKSTPEQEFDTALGQVERIALLRLKELLPEFDDRR